MLPTIFESASGRPSLRFGDEALEDPVDPVRAAQMFARADQVAGGDHVVVLGTGLGYRLQHLAELDCPQPIVFEPCPAIVDLARHHGPGLPHGATVFTELEALQRHLLSVSKPNQQTLLLAATPYKRAFPQEHASLVRLIEEVQGLVMLQRNSVMDRSAMLAERAVSNLPRLLSVPALDRIGRPLEGRPAFLVAAGPSLDGNRHLLETAARRGPVFAVNTSAPVLNAIDAPIDLLVAIEALDVTEPIAAAARVTRALGLDLTAGGANFDAEIARKVAFLADAPAYRGLARDVGIEPIGYGGSVATASLALAVWLGADPIVLLGQDLAYTGGRGYAKDTLYEATRVYRDKRILYIDRAKKWDETTARGGLRVPSKLRPVVDVPAWGGKGEVWSTHELVHFRRWFEMAAEQCEGTTRLINATEGGASIAGFEELRLEDVLRDLPEREHGLHSAIDGAATIEAERVRRTAKGIARDARQLERAASRYLSAAKRRSASAMKKAQRQVRAAAVAAPLAETHASPALMKIMDDASLSKRAREAQTYEAIRTSSKRIAALADAAASDITT